MRRLLFAANWKMNLGPEEAREYARRFRARFTPSTDRDTWFFPSAVSLEATALAFHDWPHARVGVQDVHWEPQGAYTGATSVGLAEAAGASIVLVGHSERRHVFGESDEAAGRKLRAVLAGGLLPVFCVGETLEQRERGETEAVVLGQLGAAIRGIVAGELSRIVVAYEPVWAIGTGRNATPSDAAAVHARIRLDLSRLGASTVRVLYGGSVKRSNVAALLAERELDGVLVGGASLDPEEWAQICGVARGGSARLAQEEGMDGGPDDAKTG